jgi:adenylylsulfate kinase
MAFAVWFTGLPGSGKTSIARQTCKLLSEYKIKILQLDEIRRVITPQPAYSEEERNIVYASLAYMAYLLVECGVNVFIDATANKQRYRDLARKLILSFAEAYIECPLEVCMEREAGRKAEYAPPDIYKKARSGAAVPGVNAPYEAPPSPEIHVNSYEHGIDECAGIVASKIRELFG